MKIAVNLHSAVDSFRLQKVHAERLRQEFPLHSFIFSENQQQFEALLPEVEAALVWSFPQSLFAQAPHLQLVCTPAAGRECVDEDARGLVTTHFCSFHGKLIAESFMAMLLYFNNQLHQAVQLQQQKDWNRNAFEHRRLLAQQSLLIIGYGHIGRQCAHAAQAMGLKVVGVSRKAKGDIELIQAQEVLSAISSFDHVLNLLPGTLKTEKMIGAQHFNRMKSSACFYNFGRGSTVDEAALIEALKNRSIAFAGLDVTEIEPLPKDSELWSLDHVLLSPHSSCCYEDYLHLFIDELKTVL